MFIHSATSFERFYLCTQTHCMHDKEVGKLYRSSMTTRLVDRTLRVCKSVIVCVRSCRKKREGGKCKRGRANIQRVFREPIFLVCKCA